MVTLEAGTSSGRFAMAHSGHEFVFCLRGELMYEVDGNSYHMEAGDALVFSANLEHKWNNPGSNVTNALIILCGFHDGESPSKYHMASSSGEDTD
jgi:uncharacterized cupin superfamily protein